MPAATFLKMAAASATVLALASCAGSKLAPPAQDVSALSARSAPSNPPAPSNPSTPRDITPVSTTGQVEFRGFTPEALADFRLIPEEGSALITPKNGPHANVDGFWWRPSRLWFKIPNHCAVVVTAAPEPDRPSAFTETHECGSLGSAIQKLRGLPDTPGFYPDTGANGHGTDYPFVP